MKAFEIIERLQLMHKLISEQRTGTPDEFAKRLGIKRSTLYDIMGELRSRGFPISYHKNSHSFIYSRSITVEIMLKVKPLTDDELKEKNGGCADIFLPSPIFLDGTHLYYQRNSRLQNLFNFKN